ncbi:hypothetical protein WR25_01951 [Diploscapter pachys]|uniref:Uncharacterized protein n=1 Tax=Diploscapter pachys TaxID=2018661 RepID=A0A2A2LI79_9BILA|nr:hypothetical protein WR25_01951 [Diploscapter pachys]
MNGLFTLHKFSRSASGRWELPTKLDDCRSCKQLKMRNKLLPRWFTFEQPSASGSFVDPLTASAVPTQRESSRPSFTARLASLSSFSFPTARSQRQELNSRDKDYYENVPECMSACCRCCTAPCREVGKILSTLFNWLTCNRQSNDEDDQTPPPISRY